MKKILVLLSLVIIALGCNKEPNPGKPDTPAIPAWEDTSAGWLVQSLADAYSQWEENNKLPSTVNWEGVNIFIGEYVRAGISLALKMIDHPQDWMVGSVDYPSATFGLTTDVPFLPQEVPFSAFVELLRKQYRNMEENKAVALNMEIPGYEGSNLSTTGLAVMLCRGFAWWVEHGAFPENINTWEASYTHATRNCQVSSTVVKAARDAAWTRAGVTEASTDREKAVAIFNYARDEWTWLDYANTSRGAEKTINDKKGNCCDLSHAVIAMARLSGIPARYFHAQCHYSSGYIGHVVSQIFVEGKWYMADASNDGNTFGNVKFTDYTGLHYYAELPF